MSIQYIIYTIYHIYIYRHTHTHEYKNYKPKTKTNCVRVNIKYKNTFSILTNILVFRLFYITYSVCK